MVEVGDTVTIEGHDYIHDGTEATVTVISPTKQSDKYHSIRVKYDQVDEEGEFVQEKNGRIKEEHIAE